MIHYRPGLPTEEVMAGLRDAIRRSDQASIQVVLWLSDILSRDLYRERGCLSPHQFVHERCGFSASRTTQMLRLARIAAELPGVRDALASGRLGWTKLRVLAPVLTRANARQWVRLACGMSRRALERRIAAARERSRDEVRVAVGAPVQLRVPEVAPFHAPSDPTREVPSSTGADDGERRRPQPELQPEPQPQPAPQPTEPERSPPRAPVSPDVSAAPPRGVSIGPLPEGSTASTPGVPVTVTLRLEPLQMARLEGLIDLLRRGGHRGSREDVLLTALELAAGVREGSARAGAPSRLVGSRYQIAIAECPRCRERRVAATDRPLDPATSAAVGCDAARIDEGGRRRSAIPPSVRRRVLARDGHRCRAPGCGRRTLLEIHHRVPVSRGGTNDPSNLVTLCHGCHRSLHARASTVPRWESDDAAAGDALAPGCESGRSARSP